MTFKSIIISKKYKKNEIYNGLKCIVHIHLDLV